MEKQITLVIADDHELVREGFSKLLASGQHIRLVAEAGNGEQLVQMAGLHRPDVIITDIKMPVMDGIEATRSITQKYPEIGIIALSMFDGDYLVAEMMEAGAMGYLLKNTPKTEIIKAIEAVSRREHYYCNTISVKLANALKSNQFNYGNPLASKTFSQKEKLIIEMVCRGLYAREIARNLNLSIRTVEKYKEALLEKTNTRNTAAFITYVMKHQIIDL